MSLSQGLTLTGSLDLSSADIADNSITIDDIDFGSSTSGLTIPSLAAAPSSPSKGQIYYDSNSNRLLVYNGSEFVDALETGVGSSFTFSSLGQTWAETVSERPLTVNIDTSSLQSGKLRVSVDGSYVETLTSGDSFTETVAAGSTVTVTSEGSLPSNIIGAEYLTEYSVASQASFPFGIRFSEDGSKMFVSDGGSGSAVFEYHLSPLGRL